jgi:CDP-paratose 2-epimerase
MSAGYVLVTGGAGFIGSNVAERCLVRGERVVVFDDLSRAGARDNVDWLQQAHGSNCQVVVADVRDRDAVERAVSGADRVYHFAAPGAVASSLEDPRLDHEVNVGGTLNLLEAIRTSRRRPPLLFTSTNKVYGALDDVVVARSASRYVPVDAATARAGISEQRPLDFHTPYGCSKGAADQYVRDYARSYGLRTVTLRASCVYGPRQRGTEDEGWIAQFLVRALRGEPITLYGDGYQVRDVLHIDDLVDAMDHLRSPSFVPLGETFNVGGGPENTLSPRELLGEIRGLVGTVPTTRSSPGRVGDPRYYVSDTAKLRAATGWRPRIGVAQGLRDLHQWLAGEAPGSGVRLNALDSANIEAAR